MELKKIIKSTSYLVSSKIVQFVLGVVKAKFGAVLLGTTGMGIYSQVNYLSQMISQITLLSMNDGLVKQIAQNKEHPGFKDVLKGLVRSYSTLVFVTVLLSFAICIFFARPLTIFFLGDYNYLTYYLLGVTCVPILIINSISFALLKSYKATKEISRANIFSAILSLCSFIPLVYFFSITGAVVAVVVNSAIILYINNYQSRKLIFKKLGIRFKEFFSAKTEKKYSKELLYFAMFGASSGLIYIGAESFCRSMVVNMIGVNKLGLYSPIVAWGGLLTGFITPAINVYLFPRFSECKSNKEISGIINDYFYLITFLTIPFIFLAIPFRNILIELFYSKEFLDAGIYLPWHFIGLLFHMWWNIMVMVLTPTGRIKTHGIFITIMSLTNVAIVYFLVGRYGLYGWMFKFIIPYVLFTFLYFFYLYRIVHLRLTRKVVQLMLYSLAVPLLLILIDSYSVKYFLSFILVGASIFFLSANEKQFLIKKLKTIFSLNK